MSTKPTSAEEVEKASQHSKACCTIPPIVSEKEYKPKGSYQTIDGIKTYVTGPASSTIGIFVIFDIFGYYPQSLQGADIISSSPAGYRVFVPDFFDGDPCPKEWYPPTEATSANLSAWFKKRADVPAGREKALKFLESFKKQEPQIKTWVGLGFCWGGKVISLTSGENTPWTVSVQCHPAMVSGDDAAKIKIPHMMLASKDENPEDVEAFEKNLKIDGSKKLVQTFDNMIHGWMAARSDLDNPNVVKDYEKGYQTPVGLSRKEFVSERFSYCFS